MTLLLFVHVTDQIYLKGQNVVKIEGSKCHSHMHYMILCDVCRVETVTLVTVYINIHVWLVPREVNFCYGNASKLNDLLLTELILNKTLSMTLNILYDIHTFYVLTDTFDGHFIFYVFHRPMVTYSDLKPKQMLKLLKGLIRSHRRILKEMKKSGLLL